MPYYMIQGAYTSESWAAQIANPQNRIEIVKPIFERLGGRIESAYFAFGEYDIVVIAEFPDNVSAAAVSVTINAGGAFKTAKTTALMTIEEGIEVMRKAGGSGYRPPGS